MGLGEVYSLACKKLWKASEKAAQKSALSRGASDCLRDSSLLMTYNSWSVIGSVRTAFVVTIMAVHR